MLISLKKRLLDMGTFVIFVLLSLTAEISSYNLLALEKFESFYIISSDAINNTSPIYIKSLLEKHETINVFDYHYREKCIFYSGHNTNGLMRLFFGSKQEKRTRIVQRTFILDVAVDWVQDKVYWTDSTEIHSVDLEGSNDQLVLSLSSVKDFTGLKTIESFDRIAIDPFERALFFTLVVDDMDDTKTLFRSDLQGNYLIELRTNNLNESVIYFKPDHEQRRLYVQTTTQKGSYFYAMSYDGKDILEFQNDFLEGDSPFQFFGGILHFASKFSTQHSRTQKVQFYKGILTSNGTLNVELGPWPSVNRSVTEIRVYGQDAQLSRDSFYLRKCQDMECSHNCTVLPVAGAFCDCPLGSGLWEDMKTCQRKYVHKVAGDKVKVTRNAIYDCTYNVNDTKATDYYFSKGYMFYHIQEKQAIYRQSCLVPAVVIRENVADVLGLAVDSVHDVIYWVDLPAGQLYRSDTEGHNVCSRQLLTDLDRQVSINDIDLYSQEYRNNIVVDPHKGYLFAALILKNGTYLISRFNLRVKERPKITTGQGNITSISIDVALEQIYFALIIKETNTTKIIINMCNYEFEGVETYDVPTSFGKIVSISALREKIICVGYNTNTGDYLIIEYPWGNRMIYGIGAQNKMYMYKMVSAYQQTSPTDLKCLEKRCSHICLDNTTCACPEGMRLSKSGTKCETEHETTTPPQHQGVNLVIIIIVIAILVVVVVSIFMFPWKDDIKIDCDETIEMH